MLLQPEMWSPPAPCPHRPWRSERCSPWKAHPIAPRQQPRQLADCLLFSEVFSAAFLVPPFEFARYVVGRDPSVLLYFLHRGRRQGGQSVDWV